MIRVGDIAVSAAAENIYTGTLVGQGWHWVAQEGLLLLRRSVAAALGAVPDHIVNIV